MSRVRPGILALGLALVAVFAVASPFGAGKAYAAGPPASIQQTSTALGCGSLLVSATVLDALGNIVDNGTPVTFTTSAGGGGTVATNTGRASIQVNFSGSVNVTATSGGAVSTVTFNSPCGTGSVLFGSFGTSCGFINSICGFGCNTFFTGFGGCFNPCSINNACVCNFNFNCGCQINFSCGTFCGALTCVPCGGIQASICGLPPVPPPSPVFFPITATVVSPFVVVSPVVVAPVFVAGPLTIVGPANIGCGSIVSYTAEGPGATSNILWTTTHGQVRATADSSVSLTLPTNTIAAGTSAEVVLTATAAGNTATLRVRLAC